MTKQNLESFGCVTVLLFLALVVSGGWWLLSPAGDSNTDPQVAEVAAAQLP